MQELTLLSRAPLTFGLAGEIYSQNADTFSEEVVAEYEKSPADLVFDCAKLEFLDSTALGTFVRLNRIAREGGHTLKLCRLAPRLKKLFVICKLDTVMEIAE